MKRVTACLIVVFAVVVAVILFAPRFTKAQDPGQQPVPPRPQNVLVVNTPAQAVPVTGTVKVDNFPAFPSSYTAAKQTWEYRVIGLPANATPADTQAAFSPLGSDGFEYVGIAAQGGMVFKRPR